jgi:PmbA protein
VSSFDPNQQLDILGKTVDLILEEARRGESCDIEVMAQSQQDSRIVFEGKDFSLSSQSAGQVFGIRCLVGGRLGFITTNSMQPEDLKSAVREVKQLARLSPPSEHHQLSKNSGPSFKDQIWDDGLGLMTPRELFETAQMIVDECRMDSRVVIEKAETTLSPGVWMLANSNGVRHQAAQTTLGWFAMGVAQANGEVTSFDYDGGSVAERSRIQDEVRSTMGRFRDSTVASLGAKHGKAYRGAVLLHPSAVAELMLGAVTANCNGLRHQDGMSGWKDKMDQQVASSFLNVREEPRNRARPEGWRLFDREGVATVDRYLIEEGRLKFVAHNCFSAHRGNTSPTGNASGGARTLPSIGFANLSLTASPGATVGAVSKQPAVRSLAQLCREVGSGLVMKRFSGNEDPVSGQFSGVAKNSWWLENGQKTHAVQEVMVSGNLFDLLKGCVGISTETQDIGGTRVPYALIQDLSVIAG